MRTKKLTWVAFGAALGMALFCACNKQEETSGPSSASPSTLQTTQPSVETPSTQVARAANPINDYQQPYLSDEKVTKFIDSLKEDKNPFEMIFQKGGEAQTLSQMKEKLEEFNAFARKYGFKDYEDYTAVWGRITVAQMEMVAQDMKKGSIEMMEKMAQSAEKELQKPNLDPEMKKMWEEQLASSKKSLEDLKKPDTSGLNEADVTLVKKYKAQIEEATKKYSKKSG